jgi:hypothetical protein
VNLSEQQRRLVEEALARRAVGKLPFEDLPASALQWIEAGIVTDTLCELATAQPSDASTILDLWFRTADELRLSQQPPAVAVVYLMRDDFERVLSNQLNEGELYEIAQTKTGVKAQHEFPELFSYAMDTASDPPPYNAGFVKWCREEIQRALSILRSAPPFVA